MLAIPKDHTDVINLPEGGPGAGPEPCPAPTPMPGETVIQPQPGWRMVNICVDWQQRPLPGLPHFHWIRTVR